MTNPFDGHLDIETTVDNSDTTAPFDPFVPMLQPDRQPVPTVPWIGNAHERFVVASSVPERFRESTGATLGRSPVPDSFRSNSTPDLSAL